MLDGEEHWWGIMGSLVDTIERGLANIGRESFSILIQTLDAFDELCLPDQARVSAIATALLDTAGRHHSRHSMAFLAAVRTWALESPKCERPSAGGPEIELGTADEAIGAAASVLSSGADALLLALQLNGTPLEDRVVAELTLFTRLLSSHDLRTIVLLLAAVEQAVAADLGCRRRGGLPSRGRLVLSVRLQPATQVDREVDLSTAPVWGVA